MAKLTKEQVLKAHKEGLITDETTLAIFAMIKGLEEKINDSIPSINSVIEKVKGDVGEKGEQGITGEKGEKGKAGEQGNEGKKGDRGETGQKGERGNDAEAVDTKKIISEAAKQTLNSVKDEIPKIEDIVNELPKLSTEIRDAIELLDGAERVSITAIAGLENYEEVTRLAKSPKIGGGSVARNFYQLFDVPQSYADQAGKVLQVNAGETALEFSAAGSGDVSKVGTPVDSQIGVWTGDGTIEGHTSMTYDRSNLQFTGDLGSTGTRITKGWFTDLTVTNAIAGSITGNAATVTKFTPAGSSLTLGGVAASITLLTSGATTVGVPSSGTLATTTQAFYIGTTQVAINRGSGALTLAGLTLTTPDIGTPSAGTLTNCSFPTLNQNTTGTAANLSGTPAIPDGTTATTQAPADNSTKLATTAYADAAAGAGGAAVTLANLAGVAINTDLISDTADTDSLGSATKEWLNLYIGDAGKIYLGLGQDCSIERSAANEMTLTATSGVTVEGVKIDGGVVTGATSITSTAFVGALTGEADTVATITGLAPDTATTQATQAAITTCANLTTVGALASGSIAAGFGDIQLSETSIKLDATLSGDAKWSGITTAGTSGVTTLAVGDLIYLNADDGRWELVDANLSDGYDKQLGIALTAAADGAALEVLIYGKVRSATFPAFTVGSVLYVSETAGDVTHTAPSTASVCVRKVGCALTAEDMLFAPEQTIVIKAA
ncbi:MAG: hypothetical protein GY861_18085 [bacterium]|nr:hypothetical protein [bacterium]